MARDIEMSTKYDPSQVEPGRYRSEERRVGKECRL